MKVIKISTILGLICMVLSTPLGAKEKAALPKDLPFKMAEQVKADSQDAVRKLEFSGPSMHRISGQVAAASKSALSFRVQGFIQNMAVKPGDIVKKGEILASLDPSDYELQLSLAKVNRSQAQVQENMALNDYNREKQLKLEGASTGALVEQAEFKLKQAQNNLQKANLEVKSAEVNLERTKLRAPYNCIAATQFKDKAERVGIETTVFEVYEVNSTEVNLNVPENLVGKLIIGSKISVSVPSVNYLEETIVTKIVPIVSESSRTFKVTATLKNTHNKVVPGLFAEAQIH